MQPLVTIYDSLATVLLCALLWRNSHIFKEHFHKGFFSLCGGRAEVGRTRGAEKKSGTYFHVIFRLIKNLLSLNPPDFKSVEWGGRSGLYTTVMRLFDHFTREAAPESHGIHNRPELAVPVDWEKRACAQWGFSHSRAERLWSPRGVHWSRTIYCLCKKSNDLTFLEMGLFSPLWVDADPRPSALVR